MYVLKCMLNKLYLFLKSQHRVTFFSEIFSLTTKTVDKIAEPLLHLIQSSPS